MRKIIIIGGGVVGCSVARELSRFKADILVLEKHGDIACGTSKANSGIVHAGFDAKQGTLKAKFNVLGNKLFDELSAELEFPFRRCGAMVLCFDENDYPRLTALYQSGVANGVQDLEVLSGDAARKIEPNISPEVKACLFAKTSGIVDPYEMTIAYAENACENGVKFELNKNVVLLSDNNGQMRVECDDGSIYTADMIVNCAGVRADDINNFVCEKKRKIVARRGEYMLLDKEVGYIATRTLFQLPSNLGKGILVTPTTHGNILVGPSAVDIDDKDDCATTLDGLQKVWDKALLSLPTLNKRNIITQFSGLRAHCDADDFVIGLSDCKGLYNCLGIESPGLTASPAIANFVADEISRLLSLARKDNFQPHRKAIPQFSTMTNAERNAIIKTNKLYGNVVCRCEMVTEGEIVECIRRPVGARDLDGVKRRVRAGMGRCQAGFCTARIMEIISRETGVPMTEITKNDKGSNLLVGAVKNVK
ncbi:MAG: NAD(P)/FAD-dependent oxidoreductase [Clostridia bacterium]